jgi:hypothetical protein
MTTQVDRKVSPIFNLYCAPTVLSVYSVIKKATEKHLIHKEKTS